MNWRGLQGLVLSDLKMKSSEYVDQERREYSLYVLQSRAVPHVADGLKAAARRILWTARDGKKYKSATLAGATMPIHPHASPESTVNTLAAPYGNNIPLLKGDGAFGTLLNPTAYGAARYTSVATSKFTNDVIFADIEIIPMEENYDGTLMEPRHFLPLIPIVLLNPQEGIAVGFASDILPRSLKDIITSQLNFLTGKAVREPYPVFEPNEQRAIEQRNGKWIFRGSVEVKNTSSIKITNLPYGMVHEKFVEKLIRMEEEGTINEFVDDSRDHYNIAVHFKRGELKGMSEDQIIERLGLQTQITENLNVINFDGRSVWSTNYVELIEKFTEWRLHWYVKRYERLANLLADDIQRYKDVLRAINRNVGAVAKKVRSRGELKEFLEEIGVVHLDYIADLPVYRFTEEEKEKIEKKLEEAEAKMKEYKHLLKSEDARRLVYVEELKDILKSYNNGVYNFSA